MNEAFAPTSLATTAAFLTFATAVIVITVAMLAQRRREPRLHGALWRVALATIALVVLGEITGAFHAGGAWVRQLIERPQVAAKSAAPDESIRAETEIEETLAKVSDVEEAADAAPFEITLDEQRIIEALDEANEVLASIHREASVAAVEETPLAILPLAVAPTESAQPRMD